LNIEQNKLHTTKKMEESSSLKTQELKFIKRLDLDANARLILAIAGLGKDYRDGPLWEYQSRYKVSHTFIYKLSKKLRSHSPYFLGLSSAAPPNAQTELLKSIRFFLETKLETKSALYGMSNLGNSLGIKHTSISFISQVLELSGGLLCSTYSSESPLVVTFLCDEVYSGAALMI